jgi:hypothetical protein
MQLLGNLGLFFSDPNYDYDHRWVVGRLKAGVLGEGDGTR